MNPWTAQNERQIFRDNLRDFIGRATVALGIAAILAITAMTPTIAAKVRFEIEEMK